MCSFRDIADSMPKLRRRREAQKGGWWKQQAMSQRKKCEWERFREFAQQNKNQADVRQNQL